MYIKEFCAAFQQSQPTTPKDEKTAIICEELLKLSKEVDSLSRTIKEMETKCQKERKGAPPYQNVCDCSAFLKEWERQKYAPPESDR